MAEIFEGTISRRELEYDGDRASIPAYDIPQGERGLVHIWGRNDMDSAQRMGIYWIVKDPDGVEVESYYAWEAWPYTGAGSEHEFIGGRFNLDKPGTYTINAGLLMNPDNPTYVDIYYGDVCTVGVVVPPEWSVIGPDTTLRISVVEEVPPEWSIIGSDVTLRIDAIPEVPPEWQIIGSDVTLHISLITVGWQVIGDDLTLAVALSEVAPPPCTPGETKCIGPDFYECSLDGEWVLVEENSPQCVVEEKEFPWLLVAGGLGVAAVAVAATTKKKKPIK